MIMCRFKGSENIAQSSVYSRALSFSLPFSVYINYKTKSSKKALLSYISLNNSVKSEIAVLTTFSKGEGEFLTLLTLRLFLPLNGKWRPEATFNVIIAINGISLYLGIKQKKNIRKKFKSYPKCEIYIVNGFLALTHFKNGVITSFSLYTLLTLSNCIALVSQLIALVIASYNRFYLSPLKNFSKEEQYETP